MMEEAKRIGERKNKNRVDGRLLSSIPGIQVRVEFFDGTIRARNWWGKLWNMQSSP